MLSDIELPRSINTSKGSPIKDFFIPALAEAIEYSVAVGYFSSEWIKNAAEGIANIALRGGKIRWIISPTLSENDQILILENSNQQNTLIQDLFFKNIEHLINELSDNTKNAIAWLIKDGILEFKFAIPKNNLYGIFHVKEGYLRDKEGGTVAFDGSYNTTGAAESNWEKINIFSADIDSERVLDIINDFEEKWNNQEPNLLVIAPDRIILEHISSFSDNTDCNYNLTAETDKTLPHFPFEEGPRPYQMEAHQNWKENNHSGIFSMATGTGKTITSLNCLLKIFEKDKSYNAIICVPNKNLVTQWLAEVAKFNFNELIIRFDSENQNRDHQVIELNNRIRFSNKNFVIVSTYQSLSLLFKRFKYIPKSTLFIADEAHNMGAPSIFNILKNKTFKYKIGLSATPGRFFSELETNSLNTWFNDSPPYCYDFPLKKAISEGYLCEYHYMPYPVYLNDFEYEEYQKLSIKIVQVKNMESSDDSYLESLLLKRKKIINNCIAKVDLIPELLIKHNNTIGHLKYCIVYVSDGQTDEDGKLLNTISENIASLKINNLRISEYATTAHFSKTKQLANKLKSFSNGEIDVLVAIKMLDEGVDIPRAEIGVLSSSSRNPREYIQRMGRLLRQHPLKKKAFIYDLFVLPRRFPENDFDNSLFKNELKRICFIADSARNYFEVRESLETYCNRFNTSWDEIESEKKDL